MKSILVIVFIGGLLGPLVWMTYGPSSDPRPIEESVTLGPPDEAIMLPSNERHLGARSDVFSRDLKPRDVESSEAAWTRGIDNDSAGGPTFVAAHEVHVDATDSLDVLPIVESIMFNDVADIREATIAERMAPPPEVVSLDRQYFAEEHDSQWASAKEAYLSQLFVESRVLGTQLNSAGCRTTLCRVEVSHIDPRAERRFIAAFVGHGEFAHDERTGYYYRAVDSNGVVSSVYYLARDGGTFN